MDGKLALSESARQELAKRTLARRNMKYFVPYVFTDYNMYEHNELMCDALDLVVDGIINRLMIFTHPRSGKSELVSRKLPAFFLGKHPELEVMGASYNLDLIATFSREARDLLKNQRYRNIFGDYSAVDTPVAVSKDKANVAEWKIDGHRGGMKVAGVGGGITGYGFTLGIIDDPVKDDAEAQSELMRNRVYDWYWGSFHTRQAVGGGGRIILTMTRWHEDDLAGRLLRLQDSYHEYWYLLRFPALAESPNETRQFCEENWVFPELLLTRERVKRLREMPVEERPHIRLRNERSRSS
jgi:hypothetical protein